MTRVAREVGTEGMLAEQARVPGVAGTWRDLTDSVNSMASNLTNQVRSRNPGYSIAWRIDQRAAQHPSRRNRCDFRRR